MAVPMSNKRYLPLLLSTTHFFVGSLSSTLLSKYYFIHKGSSRWVSTWVQSAGFLYLVHVGLKQPDVLMGEFVSPCVDFVSPLSSQLVFNSSVCDHRKQKITFMNLNCVILLTLSSVLLALESNHDKAHGLTRAKYFHRVLFNNRAGLLFAVYLPIMEVGTRGVLLCDGDGNAAGDGGCRDGVGECRDGVRRFASWDGGDGVLTCSLTGGICMTGC
ncbi:hypothetical protein F3Y22_tig00000778pilonHSYRG00112 [Hibiscus syriacus]|uniref:Uncharacterized protein n=1 Tax=Hibiscus syriacus TaxID=106335 RepID=A0A6A3D4B9_HIBSY|nr:hypothetical protein F3Y22_tig00000778pilonHSYRG00112 [Hibiscus syriacus]